MTAMHCISTKFGVELLIAQVFFFLEYRHTDRQTHKSHRRHWSP